jgi:hypothetical protein
MGYVNKKGYTVIYVGVHDPHANTCGCAYEHRIIASKMIGRPLKDTEIVHHIDGDSLNNDESNLQVIGSNAEHKALHRSPDCTKRLPGEPNPTIECKCGCGETFKKYAKDGRVRAWVKFHYCKSKTSAKKELTC